MFPIIKILVAASTFACGQVQEQQQELSHTFFIHNAGTDSIRIANSWTSCGCTQVEYDPLQQVAPQDSLPVKVIFHTKGKGGSFLETARLQIVSATDTLYQNLDLEGEVIPSDESIDAAFPVQVGGYRLATDSLDFGLISQGKSKTLQIAVKDSDPLLVTFQAVKGWGIQHDVIRVQLPDGTPARVKATALIVDDTAVGSQTLSTPRRLSAGTRLMSISNTGHDPLVIHRIYTAKGDILNHDLTVGNSPASVSIPTKVLATEGDTQIVIISNDPRHPRVNVRLVN